MNATALAGSGAVNAMTQHLTHFEDGFERLAENAIHYGDTLQPDIEVDIDILPGVSRNLVVPGRTGLDLGGRAGEPRAAGRDR